MCLTFLELRSCQPSLIGHFSYLAESVVSKLQEDAETQLRVLRKNQRTLEDHTIIKHLDFCLERRPVRLYGMAGRD